MQNKQEVVDKYLTENFKLIEQQRNSHGFSWNSVLDKIEEVIKGNIFHIYENGIFDKSDREYVRKRFLKLRQQEPTAFCNSQYTESATDSTTKFKYVSGVENKSKGAKEFTFTADNIPTEEEIISHFNIDTKKYKISQIWHKTTPSGKYSISVNLQALKGIEAEDYIGKFEKFVNEYNKVIFVNQTQSKFNKKGEERNIPNDVLYLVSLSDLHVGNYQKEGYLDRVKQRVFETFKSIAGSGIKKVILLNTGDMLHTNGSQSTTLSGTQLDSELPFEDAFTQGLELITSLIDYAATLSLSVTYVNVRGNHSFDTEFCLGEALKKIYQKQKNIEILNQRDTRIYYYWNNNAFLFTHGDKAVERLPLLFATEGKDFFNKAENHHILLGHTHHNSSKQFVNDRKEYAGIEVRVLGSPTSNDQWHKENGFTGNKKSIVSMLFTPEEGKYAEFNFKLFR